MTVPTVAAAYEFIISRDKSLSPPAVSCDKSWLENEKMFCPDAGLLGRPVELVMFAKRVAMLLLPRARGWLTMMVLGPVKVGVEMLVLAVKVPTPKLPMPMMLLEPMFKLCPTEIVPVEVKVGVEMLLAVKEFAPRFMLLPTEIVPTEVKVGVEMLLAVKEFAPRSMGCCTEIVPTLVRVGVLMMPALTWPVVLIPLLPRARGWLTMMVLGPVKVGVEMLVLALIVAPLKVPKPKMLLEPALMSLPSKMLAPAELKVPIDMMPVVEILLEPRSSACCTEIVPVEVRVGVEMLLADKVFAPRFMFLPMEMLGPVLVRVAAVMVPADNENTFEMFLPTASKSLPSKMLAVGDVRVLAEMLPVVEMLFEPKFIGAARVIVPPGAFKVFADTWPVVERLLLPRFKFCPTEIAPVDVRVGVLTTLAVKVFAPRFIGCCTEMLPTEVRVGVEMLLADKVFAPRSMLCPTEIFPTEVIAGVLRVPAVKVFADMFKSLLSRMLGAKLVNVLVVTVDADNDVAANVPMAEMLLPDMLMSLMTVMLGPGLDKVLVLIADAFKVVVFATELESIAMLMRSLLLQSRSAPRVAALNVEHANDLAGMLMLDVIAKVPVPEKSVGVLTLLDAMSCWQLMIGAEML